MPSVPNDFSKGISEAANSSPEIAYAINPGMDTFENLSVEPPRDYHLADYHYEIIMKSIMGFESALDDEHEVAIKLSSFGQAITLNIIDIAYANPSTLFFRGYVGDQRASLIQHVSQLSILLLSVKKSNPDKPARRFGIGKH